VGLYGVSTIPSRQQRREIGGRQAIGQQGGPLARLTSVSLPSLAILAAEALAALPALIGAVRVLRSG
jgi:hypothetical protein